MENKRIMVEMDRRERFRCRRRRRGRRCENYKGRREKTLIISGSDDCVYRIKLFLDLTLSISSFVYTIYLSSFLIGYLFSDFNCHHSLMGLIKFISSPCFFFKNKKIRELLLSGSHFIFLVHRSNDKYIINLHT
jgi:hypothetical protein